MCNNFMNYYTLSGKNANHFFRLDLLENKYFDWEYVKSLAEDKMIELMDKDRDEIESNISTFQEIIDQRKRREKNLINEFNKKNIKFIKHSYIVKNHIMYGRKTTENVVKIMYMMKILFEKCNILDRWEEYKIKNREQIYTYEEKDRFYRQTYKDFIKRNSEFRL